MTISDDNERRRMHMLAGMGKPSPNLTDPQWQLEFQFLKSHIVSSKTVPCQNAEYQSYRDFIEDTLSWIRRGHTAYVFFAYQIYDLLLFERDRLYTRLIRDEGIYPYFGVWLQKERRK
ncbi:hypothetical protein [Qiania dongpingensis]|uniref:Uncharacterized protein n=1 Tax=Qiania dongpingensis TaxID=2763669 RepID=A0A7G9G5I8_9FIRM|nr:hypothetical protein [Qiania dongpingensis]QNM06070.1 hypothetical protein H9Q78_02595 [Qiania dongpingensis]